MSVEIKTIRSDIPGQRMAYGGAPAASALSKSCRRMVVSPGITLTGEILNCDHLVVEGMVDAKLTGCSRMDICERGFVQGAVEVDESMIAGRFDGTLIVRGRLSLKSTAVVTGTISYGSLEMEADACLTGAITRLAPQDTVAVPKLVMIHDIPRKADLAPVVLQDDVADIRIVDDADRKNVPVRFRRRAG